jgi:hypothetical protein
MGQKGPSQSVENTQQQLTQEQISLAQNQQAQSSTLFNEIGLPGLQTAKSYYDKLASGDPNSIFTAVAPATEQIDAQTAATVKNIQDTSPRGGTKLLGEEEAKIAGAGQKGNLITQAYTSAFPAEAQLGQGGAGLSVQEVATALQGFQGAGQTTAQLGQEQAAGKAAQLGFFGALAGSGAEIASAGLTSGESCWIAEALWGIDDARTHVVRWWLNHEFASHWYGAMVMWAYRRWGRQIAARVERKGLLYCLLKPVFEHALNCAEMESGLCLSKHMEGGPLSLTTP